MAVVKNNHRLSDLDFKSGKELFYHNLDSIDEDKLLSEQHLSEDLLALKYNDCIIDVGMYGDHALTIQVIEANEKNQMWSDPYCIIRCFDIDDFYIQLQRAIDLYPGKMPK